MKHFLSKNEGRSVPFYALLLLLFCSCSLSGMAQNPWWYMPPYLIYTNNGSSAPSPINILPPATTFNLNWGSGINPVANGVYNPPLGKGFYISDNEFFNLFSQTPDAYLPVSQFGGVPNVIVPEAQVIKAPGACEKYFVVYSEYTYDPVRFVEVDLNLSTGKYEVNSSGNLSGINSFGYLGMATSKINSVTGKRNLYVLIEEFNGGPNGFLYRYEVDASGINQVSLNMVSGIHHGTTELELSEDGSMLAWCNYVGNGNTSECFVLEGLGANGSIPPGNINLGSPNLRHFTVTTSNGDATGVEFANDCVYFSAGDPQGPANTDGLYVIVLPNNTISLIPNSSVYANSQLETGLDKQVYAATKVGAGNYTMQAIDIISNTLHPTKIIQDLEVFSAYVDLRQQLVFPDQIDDEDYPLSNGVWADAGPDQYVCSGACVNLGIATCEDFTDNVTYTWHSSNNGGASWTQLTPASTYNSPTITVQVGGSGMFRVTATEPYDGSVLTATDIVNVNVNPWCHSICPGSGGGGGEGGGEGSWKTASLSNFHDFAFNAYPNPTQSGTVVTLEIKNPEAGEANIALMDLQGRVLRNRNVQLPEGQSQIELATDQLPAGLFTLRVECNGVTYYQKLVIQ